MKHCRKHKYLKNKNSMTWVRLLSQPVVFWDIKGFVVYDTNITKTFFSSNNNVFRSTLGEGVYKMVSILTNPISACVANTDYKGWCDLQHTL